MNIESPRHGCRAAYQAGCRCTPCRAANAAYEAAYRTRKRQGQPILGAVVSAVEAQRQLRLLTTEYETAAALADRLGFRNGHLQFGPRMTVRNVLKIRRRYQLDILAGLPAAQADGAESRRRPSPAHDSLIL